MAPHMDKKYLQSVYNTLNQYRNEYYCSSGRNQARIEESVRLFGDTLPEDVYEMSNPGSASGFFKPAFFQGDLEHSLSILEKELNK